MKLYSYPTSSASYRVRIALHLKGISFETVTVNLPKGEQRETPYGKINPQQRVPSLRLDDGTILTQSLAIIGYLDQVRPVPPLYPSDPIERAKVAAVALAIASEIQPLNNSSVVEHLREAHGFDDAAVSAWMARWIRSGFAAVEHLIDGTHYCFGKEPTIADVCLVPQVFNAHRYKVELTDFPKITAAADVATAHPAFAAAHPSRHPPPA